MRAVQAACGRTGAQQMTIDLSATPHVARAEQILRDEVPFMANKISEVVETFGPELARRMDETLAALFPEQAQLERAVLGYAEFAIDALRLHAVFETTGAYQAKTYAEAAREVYHSRDYMTDLYLPGILLSHFLWPHHYRQREFFEAIFMAEVRRSNDKRFYDVGVGTGYFSRLMLQGDAETRGVGIDISETAAEFTGRHVAAFGLAGRYRMELRDAIERTPEEARPFLLSVEVLEHLEDPIAFLRALRCILQKGGKGFITAALNAPNADHIYLYRTPLEVAGQLTSAGFHVEQYQSAFAYAPRKNARFVPEIAAFIVT